MRGINGVDSLVIGFLRRGHFSFRGIPGFLRNIKFPLALIRLLLRRRVCIAQVQHILLCQFCVITRLLQITMRCAGEILSLAQRIAAIFNGHLRLGKTRREQQQRSPYPSTQVHDFNYGSNTVEPVVLRDSRSRCACAASRNG